MLSAYLLRAWTGMVAASVLVVACGRTGYERQPLPVGDRGDTPSGDSDRATDGGGGGDTATDADGVGDSVTGGGDGGIIPGGDGGDPPPAPLQLVTTPDSDTRISAFWLGGGGTTAGYRLAWVAGSVPPPSCAGGVPNPGHSYVISGLQPWTSYAFRLCAVSSGGVESTTSLTATQRTLPLCDQTVSANETFVDFQARIDAGLDANGDGRRTICIADSVEVATRSSAEGGTLTLGNPADFTTICARRGDDARIVNYRTDSTGFQTMSAIRVWQGEQAQLANLRLEAFGTDGECIDGQLADGSVGFVEISNIDCLIHGDSAHALDFTSRPAGAIKDIRITVDGPGSVALVFGGAGQVVDDFAMFHIDLATGCSNAGCAFDLNGGADFLRVRWGTITGSLSNGYIWDQGSAHVGSLEDMSFDFERPGFRVDTGSIDGIERLDATAGAGTLLWLRNGASIGSIRDSRLAVTSAASGGILLQTGSSIGALRAVELVKIGDVVANPTAVVISDDSWVVSDRIERVAVCSAATAAQKWEEHMTSSANGLLEGNSGNVPTAHTPYSPGSVLGAQTFPFDILDGSGAQAGTVASQNILLGGVCP